MKMSKLKYFLSVIVFFVLFGLLVTRVQANQKLLEDNRNEIKNFVQSYFNNRYEIKKSLESNNLHDYFEIDNKSLSTSISELDKLDLEIYNAKLNHLALLQYKVILDFENIEFEGNYQTAFVTVVEGSDVIFEVLSPQVSSMRNIHHTITLHKITGDWKIASDIYSDNLWRQIKSLKKSKSDFMRIMDFEHNQLENERPKFVDNQSTMVATSSNQYPYNRAGAVAYADQWALGRNLEKYADFSGEGAGDCTNFTSQAIKEGGGAIMAFGGTHDIFTPGWYYYNPYDRSAAWVWVGDEEHGFYNFTVLEPEWSAGPSGEERSNNNVGHGDIIQFKWDGDAIWDHSVIIVDSIDLGYGNMLHIVDAHSDDHYHYPMTYYTYVQVRYIHINYLRGYHNYIPLTINNGQSMMDQSLEAYPAPSQQYNHIIKTPQAYPVP